MYKQKINEHFKQEYPREACGVLCIKKGKLEWVPVTNIAANNENFSMDPTEYTNLLLTSEIIAIIHSHPDGSPEPSDYDIKNCNAMGIPYYIYSYAEMEKRVVNPK
jgi:proteasome lid subunit RPN8/RPN11